MPKMCEFCEKKTVFGVNYARRGASRRSGGSGEKISGKTNRTFRPNLQKVRALIDGTVRRVTVCTGCLSAGKVKKAPTGNCKIYAEEKASGL